MAEAAARGDPADFPVRLVLAVGWRVGDIDAGPRERVGAQVGATHAGHEWVGGRPLNGRERERGWVFHRGERAVRRTAIAGTPEHGDASGRCRDERMPQVEQGLRAGERLLGRREALRDHVCEVVVDDELLGVHHRREALDAERLRRVRGHVDDVRPRRDRVRPLDVKRGLERPDVAGLRAGAVGPGRRCLDDCLAVPEHMLERRRRTSAACARLAAHVRQAHLTVEISQVGRDIRVAERVDDRDRHAPAIVVRRVHGAQVVRVAHRCRREAAAVHREAVRLRRWRLAGGEELEFADGRDRFGKPGLGCAADGRCHGQRRHGAGQHRHYSHAIPDAGKPLTYHLYLHHRRQKCSSRRTR